MKKWLDGCANLSYIRVVGNKKRGRKKMGRKELKDRILFLMRNQVRGNTAGAIIAYSEARTAQIVLSAMQCLNQTESNRAYLLWKNPIKYFIKEFKKYIKDAAMAKITAMTYGATEI